MVSVHVRLWSHAFISKSEGGTKLIPTLNELMERDGANGHLRYPWQHLAAEAFTESNASLLPKRINAAERAISARLLDPTATEKHERTALREALAALRKLIQETTPQEKSRDKRNKEIA
jgi:hypothetical protein